MNQTPTPEAAPTSEAMKAAINIFEAMIMWGDRPKQEQFYQDALTCAKAIMRISKSPSTTAGSKTTAEAAREWCLEHGVSWAPNFASLTALILTREADVRERCAQIADDMRDSTAWQIAAAIRAEGR